MQKFNNCLKVFFFLMVFTLINFTTLGQTKIKWEESPSLAKDIKDVVPEGKALFVFETKDSFIFDSDNENIVQPNKIGQFYKFWVSINPPSGAILIKHETAGRAYINYGKFMISNSLPSLNSGDIKYFKLSIVPCGLISYEETAKIKKEGAANDFQGLFDKEALIIINVYPKDLKVEIEGKEITKTIPDEGRYKVYVKPIDQILVIKSKNYDDGEIVFENNSLSPKDVRYFHVEPPQLNIDAERLDPNIKVGNYSIESNPSGALIQMTGRPDFNQLQYKTPHVIEGYKAGTEIVTLSLDRYETEVDTILISKSKGKKLYKNLIPKFSFINCNLEPAIPSSKVLMDGEELVSIVDGKDYECPKGNHIIEIVSPHFYSEKRQVNLAAGKTNEINVKLKPKMGTLSITPDENSMNAEVYIDMKKIGKLPIQNYSLQEGDYSLSYKKSGFATEKESYNVTINENKNTLVSHLKMVTVKEIQVYTFPVQGAALYFDGVYMGKSNLTCKIGLGSHTLKIQKENFEEQTISIVVSENSSENNFSYTLVPLLYNVFVSSRPGNASVYLDGEYKGTTPITIKSTYGMHSFKMTRDHYFDRKAVKSVNSSGTTSVHKTLFPERMLNLNLMYGLNSFGFEVGGTIKYFTIGIDWFPYIINDIYKGKVTPALEKETFTLNNSSPGLFVNTNQKYSLRDSSGTGYAIKAGFVLLKPFMMRIHIGYGWRTGFYTNEIYRATGDFTYNHSTGGQGQGYKDDLVRGETKKEEFNSFIMGIEFPIFNRLNILADYYLTSERGSGFIWGLGINIL